MSKKKNTTPICAEIDGLRVCRKVSEDTYWFLMGSETSHGINSIDAIRKILREAEKAKKGKYLTKKFVIEVLEDIKRRR